MNAKRADLIEVSFEVWTHGVFRNHLLDGLARYKNLLTINYVLSAIKSKHVFFMGMPRIYVVHNCKASIATQIR